MLDTKTNGNGGPNVYRKLTIEMFQNLLKTNITNVGTTKPENGKLDFHEDIYQLQSLQGIKMVGSTEKKTRTIRDGTTEFMLGKNQLTSLLPLALDDGIKMFAKMEKIDAKHNTISSICADLSDLHRNEWPYKMVCLTDLDLSHNQLSTIPNLKTMPALKILKASHNKIRPPWKQLKLARELEELDLSDNLLDWTEAEFLLEVKVLRELRVLRSLKLARNPFCQTMPDYVLFCLKELATAQVLFLGVGSKTKYFINNIDGNECNDAMHDRAMSIKQPDRKRREFLAKVGYRGNIRLIDSNKEKRYLKSVVRKIPNGEEKTEYDDDDGENFEEEKELATGLASKADTEASLYKLIMLADLCAQNPSAATPAISMMLKCVFFVLFFLFLFSCRSSFFWGKTS